MSAFPHKRKCMSLSPCKGSLLRKYGEKWLRFLKVVISLLALKEFILPNRHISVLECLNSNYQGAKYCSEIHSTVTKIKSSVYGYSDALPILPWSLWCSFVSCFCWLLRAYLPTMACGSWLLSGREIACNHLLFEEEVKESTFRENWVPWRGLSKANSSFSLLNKSHE